MRRGKDLRHLAKVIHWIASFLGWLVALAARGGSTSSLLDSKARLALGLEANSEIQRGGDEMWIDPALGRASRRRLYAVGGRLCATTSQRNQEDLSRGSAYLHVQRRRLEAFDPGDEDPVSTRTWKRDRAVPFTGATAGHVDVRSVGFDFDARAVRERDVAHAVAKDEYGIGTARKLDRKLVATWNELELPLDHADGDAEERAPLAEEGHDRDEDRSCWRAEAESAGRRIGEQSRRRVQHGVHAGIARIARRPEDPRPVEGDRGPFESQRELDLRFRRDRGVVSDDRPGHVRRRIGMSAMFRRRAKTSTSTGGGSSYPSTPLTKMR